MKESQFTARTTENIPQTKRIFKTIEDLLSEGFLQMEEDGLQLVAADPAMVALVNLELAPNYFSEEYNVYTEERAGVNLQGFHKAVRKANKDEELTIEYGVRDTSQTTWGMNARAGGDLEESTGFEVQVETEDGFWTKKGLPTLNLNEDEIPSIGDLKWENKIKITGTKMKRVIELFNSQADAVKIDVTEEGLYMEAQTDKSDKEGTFESGFENDSVEFEEEPVQSSTLLSMDYISKLLGQRMERMAEKITIHQAKQVDEDSEEEGTKHGDGIGDFPVKFSVEGEHFLFEIILAPRVEDE